MEKHSNYLRHSQLEKLLIKLEQHIYLKREALMLFYSNNTSISLTLNETLDLLIKLEILVEDERGIYLKSAYDDINVLILNKALAKGLIILHTMDSEDIDNTLLISIQRDYYALRNYFLESSIIKEKSVIDNLYVLNDKYTELIKENRLSLKDLKRILSEKEKYGELAELFVLEYEQNTYPNKHIDYVAPKDVTAGYDIKSFLDEKSLYHNKYIEVKYIGKGSKFYVSKKELEMAKLLASQYFLYIVQGLNCPPLIIQNPYEKILSCTECYIIENISVDYHDLVN